MITRRSTIWLVAAALFSLVNLAGAIMAAAGGEGLHAGAHVALLVLGAYVTWRIWRPRAPIRAALAAPGELDNRLTHLELSIEDVALQIERVGEGQRVITHLFTEHDTPPAPSDANAEPVEIATDGNTPQPRQS